MLKRLGISIWIWLKSVFGTKIEGLDSISDQDPTSSTWTKQQYKEFFDLYNVDREDKIEYTNTHEDHHSNFKHLDDVTDERFERVSEQVGLIYEADGKTPKDVAAKFDMTYEEYVDYKKKILPHAKDRKITEEEILRFLGKQTEYKIH